MRRRAGYAFCTDIVRIADFFSRRAKSRAPVEMPSSTAAEQYRAERSDLKIEPDGSFA
jgi:hypothetical protein